MDKNREEYIRQLVEILQQLEVEQLGLIEDVAVQLAKPYTTINRHAESDIVDDCILYTLGDFIRVHHSFSTGPFTKDKFEFGLEKAQNLCNHRAELTKLGTPGADIIINGLKFSLKTEAEASIRANLIHISKYMELGKGVWSAKESDLIGLRDQFFNHLSNYERIVTLRCLSKDPSNRHYELVEIPKALLLEAQNGKFRMLQDSTQLPKPGYCDVYDKSGELKFQLYFDGGGERKLQIRNLKVQYCLRQATWIFST